MSRRVRLSAWVVAIVGALAWPVFVPETAWLQTIFLIALFPLLWTSPGNAIRLRPWTSEAIIVGGTILLQAIGLKRATTNLSAAIVMTAITLALLVPLARKRISVWWIAGAVWGWWTITGPSGVLIAAVFGIVCVCVGMKRSKTPPGC